MSEILMLVKELVPISAPRKSAQGELFPAFVRRKNKYMSLYWIFEISAGDQAPAVPILMAK
jgi:hypothetical protein